MEGQNIYSTIQSITNKYEVTAQGKVAAIHILNFRNVYQQNLNLISTQKRQNSYCKNYV